MLLTIVSNWSIQGINFLTSIMAAKMLGPDARGQLAIVLIYPQFVANIMLLGFDRGLSITIGKKLIHFNLETFMSLCIILSFCSFAIFLPIAHWQIQNPGVLRLAFIYSAYIPFFYMFILIMAAFQGHGNFKDYNAGRLAFYVAYVVLLASLWVCKRADLSGFVIANLGAVIIAATYSSFLYWYRYRHASEAAHSTVKNLTVLLKNSWMFIVPMLLTVVSSQIDQIIINRNMDAKLLGLYVVYLAYSRLAGSISNAFNVHMFHASIIDETQKSPLKFARMGIIYFMMSILLVVAAKPLITLLYGKQYLSEVIALYLVILSSFIFFLSQMLSEYFRGKQLTRIDIGAGIIYICVLCIPFAFAQPQQNLLTFSSILLCAEIGKFLYYLLAFRRKTALNLRQSNS